MEKAWELAVVSAVGQFHSLMLEIASLVSQHPDASFGQIAEKLSEGDGREAVYDFTRKYSRAIDAAIDEVTSSARIPNDAKPVLVSRMQNFRMLITYGFAAPNANKALDTLSKDHSFPNLVMIYSAVVAGGTKPLFSHEEAKQVRAELESLYQKLQDYEIDADVKAAMLSNIKAMISILSDYALYGAQDAQLRLKALNSDAVVLRNISESELDRDQADAINLEIVQPIQKMARLAYSTSHNAGKFLTYAAAGVKLIEKGVA